MLILIIYFLLQLWLYLTNYPKSFFILLRLFSIILICVGILLSNILYIQSIGLNPGINSELFHVTFISSNQINEDIYYNLIPVNIPYLYNNDPSEKIRFFYKEVDPTKVKFGTERYIIANPMVHLNGFIFKTLIDMLHKDQIYKLTPVLMPKSTFKIIPILDPLIVSSEVPYRKLHYLISDAIIEALDNEDVNAELIDYDVILIVADVFLDEIQD